MNSTTRWVVLAAALAACSSGKSETGDTGATPTTPPGTTPAISAFPAHVYTGFDEEGGYSAPILATGGNGTFTWSTPSNVVVTVTGAADLGTATAVAAGTGNVVITSGSSTLAVPVDVVGYTAAQRTAGEDFYNSSGCNNCHGTGNPDITSSGIGEHTDQELITAITTGINPEDGVDIGGHSFAPSGDANPGIVAFLRSQPPHGEPAVDE